MLLEVWFYLSEQDLKRLPSCGLVIYISIFLKVTISLSGYGKLTSISMALFSPQQVNVILFYLITYYW